MEAKFILLTILLLNYNSVESLRILSVLPTATKSHFASGRRIVSELARRGHEIVLVSPYEEQNANITWVPIEISSILDASPYLAEELKMRLSFFNNQRRLWRIMNAYTEHIVKLPKLKSFIENDNSKFDLVFIEEFMQPLFYVFSSKYNAPLALISTFGSGHYINEYMGNSLELSYVPHEFTDMFGEMNTLQRVKNAFYTIYDLIGRRYLSLYYQNDLAKRVFKDLKNVPHLDDLERNASLILLNSHFSMSVVRPFLPNMIEIGGVHIEKPKELNQELKTVLDNAKDGAIVFSFGSVMELSQQSEEFISIVLNVLGKLKQSVIVKWNSEKKMPIQHKNIYPFTWLPQNDVLAHQNVVLFITHGGLLGSQEAIYHGVPIICIPFYGDQPLNCKRSVYMGYGIHIPNEELSPNLFYGSIQRILSDASYRNNAKELSERFRDRPDSAISTAVFWLEYCARHKGMDFAKSPRRNLYLIEYYYVDVIVISWLVLKVFSKAVRAIVSVFKKNKPKVKTN